MNNYSNHDTGSPVVDSLCMSEDIDNALPINFNLQPVNPRLILLSEELVRELSGQKLTALKYQNNLQVMQTVMANLYHCYQQWRMTGSVIGHIPWLSFSKNKNSYTVSSRYQDKVFTHRTVVDKTIKPLIQSGHIHEVPGYFFSDSGKGRQTRLGLSGHTLMSVFADVYQDYQLTRELAVKICEGAESIILKDSNKKLTDYQDNDFTHSSRQQLTDYKGFLESCQIELSGVQIMTESLKKVFNNSDWNLGGRLYCHDFQNKSKAQRSELTINGHSVVERDFSGLHMNMAYAMQTGKTCSTYPYDYTGFGLDLDTYKPLMKVATLIAFNCNTPSSATKAITQEIMEQPEEIRASLSGKQVLAMIKEKHQPIESIFCSGFGLRLQNEDSKIASQILDTCMMEGVPALSVHDSFITPEENDQLIQDVMVSTFKDRYGCSIHVD